MKNDVLRQQACGSLAKPHSVQRGHKAADDAHADLDHRRCFVHARV